MRVEDLKHKLRHFKKLENQIRFRNSQQPQRKKYIWDKYFSTNDENSTKVKYNMNCLCKMKPEEFKAVIDEYFYEVYYEYYKEIGYPDSGLYNLELLERLGLPVDSSLEAIKSRYRELAKKYHPDTGGDSVKFIELVEIYKKLTGDR